jgi:uncharacterized protein (TIGR02466 family)
MVLHKHRGILPPDEIGFDDICGMEIFPTVVHSCSVIGVDNDQIIRECYDLKKVHEGNRRSNYGGWQSEVFCFERHEHSDIANQITSVFDLAYRAAEFCNVVARDMQSNTFFDESSAHFWININNFGNYNVLHSHPKTDLICLYYPVVKKDQGTLSLLRSDGSVHHDFFSEVPNGHVVDIDPEPEKFYIFPAHILHYVTANQTNEDRISISFNMVAK